MVAAWREVMIRTRFFGFASCLLGAVGGVAFGGVGGIGGIGGADGCSGEVEYLLDDGSGTFTIGPSQFDANMIWMNSFEAVSGGELIERVRVSFGGIEDNNGMMGSTEVRIGILNDPTDDHDPSDAVLVGSGVGTWVSAGFSEFLEFEVEPTVVEGVFYIAVEMDILQRANPARMDPDSVSGGAQSWLFYHDGMNLDDVGSSLFVLRMSDSPFLGAWMIRGVGSSMCPADLTGDGVLDFFDVSAFLSAFAAQETCGDVNGDGAFDFFDIAAFLNLYAEGCN